MTLRQENTPSERERLIESLFQDKSGRIERLANPFTCFININCPLPDLPLLTASLLEELQANVEDAYVWASRWDKSIISIAPKFEPGCVFLPEGDARSKNFLVVSTTKIVNSDTLIAKMPQVGETIIGINDQPTTIDAFLIAYFHMVNELIWRKALKKSRGSEVKFRDYREALGQVASGGFSLKLLPEKEIIRLKKHNPELPVRIYGSRANSFVPAILGIIL